MQHPAEHAADFVGTRIQTLLTRTGQLLCCNLSSVGCVKLLEYGCVFGPPGAAVAMRPPRLVWANRINSIMLKVTRCGVFETWRYHWWLAYFEALGHQGNQRISRLLLSKHQLACSELFTSGFTCAGRWRLSLCEPELCQALPRSFQHFQSKLRLSVQQICLPRDYGRTGQAACS